MSRIGKKPIPIPAGVKIQVSDGAVEVQGPKGKLRQALPPGIAFKQEEANLVARPVREDSELGKFHGLARSLVANAVKGVTEGFRKDLDIVGVGYRAEVKGKQVHSRSATRTRSCRDPTGIDVAIDKQTHITGRASTVSWWASRGRLPRCAADPYKQKGVRYTGEVLKKKAGKTGAK